MKRLYARMVLWLARPVLNRIDERDAALSERIIAAHSAAINNEVAIVGEQVARQAADAALQMQFTAQSREF
ncbi:hypothetical protein [Burkholderia cepacia]|uniref:hypothetical protein n=1 Tax=Burkholderia cepacia TaxID=292 RepID=UPI000A9E80CD|nr:hypothetical protein [Burkholderia cepacia]